MAANRAFILCSTTAALGLAGSVGLAGLAWTVWLAPVAIIGGVFAYHDAQGDGREEAAEVAGSAAFALAPAAFAILADWSVANASALALLMVGRSVPSVLFVRAFLRAAKTGVRRDAPALVAAGVALTGAALLYYVGIAPLAAVIAMLVFLLRALIVLAVFRPAWRARRIGMIEVMLGVAFVAGLAVVWHA